MVVNGKARVPTEVVTKVRSVRPDPTCCVAITEAPLSEADAADLAPSSSAGCPLEGGSDEGWELAPKIVFRD